MHVAIRQHQARGDDVGICPLHASCSSYFSLISEVQKQSLGCCVLACGGADHEPPIKMGGQGSEFWAVCVCVWGGGGGGQVLKYSLADG